MESENYVSTAGNTRSRKLYFLLEPTSFLIFFAINLSGTVYQNHILQLTCKNIFEFNATDCDKLGIEEIVSDISKKINVKTQPYVSEIFMTKTMLESVIPAILTLFLGPWSDKYGRKPVMLFSIIGYLMYFIIVSILTFFSNYFVIHPWYYIMASIPVALTGGMSSWISSSVCYIADMCRKENLALRNVNNEAAIFIGLLLGTLLSSYLMSMTSPFYVFAISTNMVLFSFLYVYFRVRDNVEAHNLNKMEMFFELFHFDLVKDMLSTCFERRDNYNRLIIWLTMFCSIIAIFIMEGNDTVIYLFVVKKFGWTIVEFTRYNAIRMGVVTIGNILGVYLLQRFFKFSVVKLALLGLASSVLDSVIKATAAFSREMYLAIGVGAFGALPNPMKRTLLSYIVPEHDLGKILSLTISLESLSALGGAPLYTFVYNSTLEVYAGAFHFITAGLYLLCYIFMAIIYGIQKSDKVSAYLPIN